MGICKDGVVLPQYFGVLRLITLFSGSINRLAFNHIPYLQPSTFDYLVRNNLITINNGVTRITDDGKKKYKEDCERFYKYP